MTTEAVAEETAASHNESDINDDIDTEGAEEFDDAFDEFSSAADDDDPIAFVEDIDFEETNDEEKKAASKDDESKDPVNNDSESEGVVDIWANATPEQKAALNALQENNAKLANESRTHMGRYNAFMRKFNDLEKQLKDQNETDKDADVLKLDDIPEEIRELYDEDELKGFIKISELVAGKKTGAVESQVTELRNNQTQSEETRAQEQRKSNHITMQSELDDQVDGWRELDKDPGFKAFLEGVDPVTGLQRQQLYVNAYQSNRVVGMASLYEQYRDIKQAQVGDEDPPPGNDNKSDKRREKLERSVNQPSKAAGGKTTSLADDDFDAAFDHYSSKADRDKR